MSTLSEGISAKPQDILTGSSILYQGNPKNINRIDHMHRFMAHNKAYIYAKEKCADNDLDQTLLKQFQSRFSWYRQSWKEQPQRCIKHHLLGEDLAKHNLPPLSIDIETAAICDLACPFCFREYIATPDKTIADSLFYSLVDQAAELNVPSIKLNWRGEPLMNPKLPEYIDYAKKSGVLDTIINTNATHLNGKKSRQLIESGLDFMIYSFDGGTQQTYEKMRPGRFKENTFEAVYENIKQFHRIREELGSPFPRTKIQMILMEETHHEKEQFFSLFQDYVDEVTVTQYSERGGNITDLDTATQEKYFAAINAGNLPDDTPYMKTADDELFISDARNACEQPYQRLMVTYDGRVGMCCHDWGAMHTIGYVDSASFQHGDSVYSKVMDKINKQAKGFELMQNVQMPNKFNQPDQVVQTLKAIWEGNEMDKIRSLHINQKVNDAPVCKGCHFKDTYQWKKA